MSSVAVAHGYPAGRSGVPLSRSGVVLVGRTLEQILLREELAAACKGSGRLVLLGGEAGIGKTALARDLVGVAVARGCHVLGGACYDLTHTPPYGPWLDLFDAASIDRDLLPPPARLSSSPSRRLTGMVQSESKSCTPARSRRVSASRCT